MKNIHLIVLLLIHVSLYGQSNNKKQINFKRYDSCWKIKDVIYEQNGGMYSTEDIKKLEGKIICFDRDTLNFFGDTAIHPSYSYKKESTIAFIQDKFRVYSKYIKTIFRIGSDSLIVIKVTYLSYSSGTTFKIKKVPDSIDIGYDGKYLYFPYNGALFRLAKVKKI